MIRLEPIEEALPPEWRRVVRDHPFAAVAGAALAGMYLGRQHGRRLIAALAAAALTAGVEKARGGSRPGGRRR